MPNTVFTSFDQARKSLTDNRFTFTKWITGVGAKTADFNALDQYLDGYATIATFLCNAQRVEAALTQVSSDLWDAYRTFPANIRNKFTRALNKVAASYGFDYQNRFTVNTNNTRPIGIKLVGGDPQLGYMLRNKLFWKDSMDLRHGEHSHSLQWLAIAQAHPALNPTVADLYSQTSAFRGTSKNDQKGERSMLMWQWIADCFPSDMSRLATEEFLNGETLQSHSYRSPQVITDYLMNNGPIDGHFVSTYLFHRYKNRNWLTTEKAWDAQKQEVVDRLKQLHTGDPTVIREGSMGARSWAPSPSSPDARLIRDAKKYWHAHDIAPVQQYDVTFHGRRGLLCYYYSE